MFFLCSTVHSLECMFVLCPCISAVFVVCIAVTLVHLSIHVRGILTVNGHRIMHVPSVGAVVFVSYGVTGVSYSVRWRFNTHLAGSHLAFADPGSSPSTTR